MKKVLTLISLLLLTINYSQEKVNQYQFDKIALTKLEKVLTYSDEYDEESKNNYLNLVVIDTLNKYDKFPNVYKYVKISSIPVTDVFIMSEKFSNILGFEYKIIQNIKTKKYYGINIFTMDWMNYPSYENRHILKVCPYVPTEKEKLLISKYKIIIKNANLNMNTLKSIQNKYLTKWYEFNPSLMNNLDKQNWNKNFLSLKKKYETLNDLNTFEDKNNHAREALTLEEIGAFNIIYNWVYNYSTF